jgi:hypothetical protein
VSNRRICPPHPDPQIIALGIRQPWAELILRGIKQIEIRSLNTQVRGRIYVYASKKLSELPEAAAAAARHGVDLETIPRGLLVGSVELYSSLRSTEEDAPAACLPAALLENRFSWKVRNPERFAPLEVRFLPYGVWFYPFQRRGTGGRKPSSQEECA